jgi:hypothetical protein
VKACCNLARHPRAVEIDEAIRAGGSIRGVASQFRTPALPISDAAVQRHRDHVRDGSSTSADTAHQVDGDASRDGAADAAMGSEEEAGKSAILHAESTASDTSDAGPDASTIRRGADLLEEELAEDDASEVYVPGRHHGAQRLTPEIQAAMIESLRAGGYLKVSAIHAGVHWDLARRWIQYGRQGVPEYADFYWAIAAAMADAEDELVKIWANAARGGDGDARAAAGLMAIRWPKRWSEMRTKKSFDAKIADNPLFREVMRTMFAVYGQVHTILEQLEITEPLERSAVERFAVAFRNVQVGMIQAALNQRAAPATRQLSH